MLAKRQHKLILEALRSSVQWHAERLREATDKRNWAEIHAALIEQTRFQGKNMGLWWARHGQSWAALADFHAEAIRTAEALLQELKGINGLQLPLELPAAKEGGAA